METIIKQITDNLENNKKIIAEAAKILSQGGLVAFPTETVFGLACLFDSMEGYQKLIEAKRRPKEKAFPFVVGNKEDISSVI